MDRELLGLLDVFVSTAEAGSFSAAAERLHLTRSAVGKCVARLEARLGVRLFHRTTRRSSLTESGQLYYEHAQRAASELQAAAALLDLTQREPRGRVRVTMPVVFGRRCVAPALLALGRRHRALELELSFTDRVVDVLEERVDLALRIGPMRDSSDLVARPLGRHHMVLCAAPGYLAQHGRPTGVPDLQTHRWLVYTRNGRVKGWDFAPGSLGEASPLRLQPQQAPWRMDDLETIREAAVAGDGLARLPTWLIAEDLHAGRLAIALTEREVTGYETYLVWPRTRVLPLKMRVVVDALLAAVPPLMDPAVPGLVAQVGTG